jgi:hypothetical protein
MLPSVRVWIGREDLGSCQESKLRFYVDLDVVLVNTSNEILCGIYINVVGIEFRKKNDSLRRAFTKIFGIKMW